MILDIQGRVLVLERSAIPDAWQRPQGGIEGDEAAIDALWRELREETGLTIEQLELRYEVPEWLGYELPPEARSGKTGRGQVHKWFVLRVRDHDVPVQVGDASQAEFSSWRWVQLTELIELSVPFREPVYRRLAEVVTNLEGLT